MKFSIPTYTGLFKIGTCWKVELYSKHTFNYEIYAFISERMRPLSLNAISCGETGQGDGKNGQFHAIMTFKFMSSIDKLITWVIWVNSYFL